MLNSPIREASLRNTLVIDMNSKRIVFLTTSLGFGGTSVVVSLAKGIAARGWAVNFIVVTVPENTNRILELNQAGISVSSLNMEKGAFPAPGFFLLLRKLKQLQPDVVHCHSVHANLLGRLARIFVRIPVLISTAHSVNEGSKARELAYRLTDWLADMTTQVSQVGAQRYVSIGAVSKNKMLFLPNGIDTTRFSADTESQEQLKANFSVTNEFVWVAIGRLLPAKNYPLMLRAFEVVSRDAPNVLLFIVGDGPLMAEIREYAQGLRLEERIRFLGNRHDVRPVLHMADAFIMSSSWEGMPMVLLEASACAVPIVATRVGGIAEVVAHEEGGYLVSPGDDQELAAAMLRMMALPRGKRRAMGQMARQRVVRNYELGIIVKRWEELYGRLLRKRIG
jgi:glycosyltransferase involved in cell wall biosynthesis